MSTSNHPMGLIIYPYQYNSPRTNSSLDVGTPYITIKNQTTILKEVPLELITITIASIVISLELLIDSLRSIVTVSESSQRRSDRRYHTTNLTYG